MKKRKKRHEGLRGGVSPLGPYWPSLRRAPLGSVWCLPNARCGSWWASWVIVAMVLPGMTVGGPCRWSIGTAAPPATRKGSFPNIRERSMCFPLKYKLKFRCSSSESGAGACEGITAGTSAEFWFLHPPFLRSYIVDRLPSRQLRRNRSWPALPLPRWQFCSYCRLIHIQHFLPAVSLV